jgi:hypothetical protein
MVKYILSIFLLFGCGTTQQVASNFECSLLNEEIKDFKFDVFGNLYTIDLRNRLKVYDSDLNFLFEYYNNILGEISHVDVSNPKKVVLFFNGFQKVIFVDDTLSEIGRYEGEFNILAIGSSRDNNIWIYDGLDYRVKKISSKGKMILESNPLESYHGISTNPDYIIEYNNMVYMVEEGEGIVVLDNFGNYSTYLKIPGLSSVILKDGRLIYNKDGAIMQQVLENPFEGGRKIKAIPAEAETAYISNNLLFFLEGRCLKKVAFD